jgi:hypothetical protein
MLYARKIITIHPIEYSTVGTINHRFHFYFGSGKKNIISTGWIYSM